METQTLTKKQAMYERIRVHGEDLNRIFNTGIEPVALCKKLRRLEAKASQLTTQACNGDIEMDYTFDTKLACILDNVNQLLCNVQRKHIPIFINQDPRGYALKINDEYMRNEELELHRDWGGYGIIAPDLT